VELVNRVALLVRPRRRFLEWANRLPDVDSKVTVDELPALTSLFLVEPDEEPDLQELIDAYAEDIFEHLLGSWTSDEALWPANRTPHVFRDWFEVSLVENVWDADAGVEWLDDDIEGDEDDVDPDFSTCAWCGASISEDEGIFTLDAAIDREHLANIAGRTLSLPIGDRIVEGAIAPPDSDAAKAGADVCFALCSEACGDELKAAMARVRGATLS
jgi:hypothetical protein